MPTLYTNGKNAEREARILAEDLKRDGYKDAKVIKFASNEYQVTYSATRKKNPTITTSTLPIGEWSPAHAIRRNADGSIDVLREKNSGKRRANISEGFMAGGVFHPIRGAADYDASRAGEGRQYKKKRKKGTRPASTGRKYAPKKASTKRAMVTSRREYGGDGSRYRNPTKKQTYKIVGTAKTGYEVRRYPHPTTKVGFQRIFTFPTKTEATEHLKWLRSR